LSVPTTEADPSSPRSMDLVKLWATTTILQQFSTREPANIAIRKVFQIVGHELQRIVLADEAYHFFLNLNLNEIDILLCQESEAYQPRQARLNVIFDNEEPWAWFYYKAEAVEIPLEDSIELTPPENPLWSLLEEPRFYAVAPFCQRGIPLGYFVFVWRDSEIPPNLFQKVEGSERRENAIHILKYLQELVTNLFTNHYPIHNDTYLPKFMEPIPKRVAILFADIRNFTPAFEAMRLPIPGAEGSPNPLVGLVQAYLMAASQIIAQPGIGRIDKFIGDGIMATFGEYLPCTEEEQPLVSCLLSIYAGTMLIDAFDKLFKHFVELDIIRRFMREYNETFDLQAGVGVNFGKASFDYFGTSVVSDDPASTLIGGYLEFTAIGDSVNTAQRLESTASKPLSEITAIERSPSRNQQRPNVTAPLILSRTVFLRLQQESEGTTGILPAGDYKSVVWLKGKGSIAEIYEILPSEIDGDSLIRTLKNLDSAGLKRIVASIEKHWNDGEFQFPDADAQKLINCYCPQ
jgi:class 3 adenylate cyclase